MPDAPHPPPDDRSGRRAGPSREAPRPPTAERHESRLKDLARRVLSAAERGDGEAAVPIEVVRDALALLLETGDRARSEVLRLAAREVRASLSELRLGEELHHLIKDYSLEVRASIHLKPLNERPASRPLRERKAPRRGPDTKPSRTS
ncbi:MAG: hypothetical protein JXB39_07980 [Deltaproteobacteria bacterium]|nr:hypothetical protein [Deltaproteobacteria bacterium]